MTQRISVDARTATALTRLLDRPHYELIPLKSMMDATTHLPTDALVSVTASPALGLDATIDASVDLAGLGFDVMPHLSARLTRDEDHVAEILTRIEGAGITRAFVVGGDADQVGDFADGLSLLEAMSGIGHELTEIGVPAYPEGHPSIPADVLLEALAAKQQHASFMTTQMCFEAEAITTWLTDMRDAGIALPVMIGIPGVAPLHRLAAISARIGIGQSIRYLSKQPGLIGNLLRPGRYTPDELLVDLDPGYRPIEGLRGVHIFTFNQVETTEEWRRELLEALTGTD